ncbi:hypothetical protein V6N11_053666 [Hibiscus sabdariffa]|uniref:Uncharacterized protein n=1 Tax=Hibiscus sabdariffa TaxID=183260 RepID=A0ABR2NED6_9ROSI
MRWKRIRTWATKEVLFSAISQGDEDELVLRVVTVTETLRRTGNVLHVRCVISVCRMFPAKTRSGKARVVMWNSPWGQGNGKTSTSLV